MTNPDSKNSSAEPQCARDFIVCAEEAIELAAQLKALAHPVRLQILHHLGDWNEGCCNDFCACIPLAQSTISQHLKILNEAGFIEFKTKGNCSHYSLNPQALNNATRAMSVLCERATISKPEKRK